MLKNRSRIIMRSIALFLSVLIAFYAIPSVIFAEVSDAIDSIGNSETGSQTDDAASIVKDVFEVKELRKENVKTFRLEDGSFVAAQYPSAVHRLDADGVWQDIDNTLSSSGSEFLTYDARVKFAKKITGNGALFTLHEGNKKITFSLDGAIKKTPGTVKTINSEPIDETKLGKLMTLNKLSSSVVYENILNGVDIEYIVTSNDIKENIIVKEKSDSYSYTFTLKLNNLSATLVENGDVHILDGEGNISYRIPAPVIYDANGNYADSGIGSYTLTDNGNGSYSLAVTASAEWMNAPGRAFPVTVDPTVSYIYANLDLYVSEAEPNTTFDTDILRVSSSSSAYGENIAYINVDTSSYLPPNAYIVSAKMTLAIKENADVYGGAYVGAYRVISDWNENLTYNMTKLESNPYGQLESNPMSYVNTRKTLFSPSDNKTLDITKLFKLLNADNNYESGIALKIIGDGAVTFKSNGTTPKITVTYKSLTGLEDYNTYSSQSIGNSVAHVNLATGNLTFTVPTLTTTDSLISFTPTLVFNNSLAKNFVTYLNAEVPYTLEQRSAPAGYVWNMRQSVVKKEYVVNTVGEKEDYYVWFDGDGTEHYFLKNSSNEYLDQDGLLLTLTVNSTALTITDKSQNVMTFSPTPSPDTASILSAWTLTNIKDSIGNKVIFVYDSLWRPIEIKIQPNGGEAISMFNIYYTENSTPAYIENSQLGEAVVFIYSNSDSRYLQQIIYAKKTLESASSWSDFQNSPYTSVGITVASILETVHEEIISGVLFYVGDNIALKQLIYDYDTNWNKATRVTEYAETDPEGQSIKYEYNIGYTDVYTSGSDDIIDTSDDIRTRYSFDNEGRTVSYYSSNKTGDIIYGAQNYTYETQENIKNNIKESVVTGGSATNYILNGGFELLTDGGDFRYWTESSAENVRIIADEDAEGSQMAGLAVSANTSEHVRQEVFVPAGKYVISFDLKTQRANDLSITLSVSSVAGSGFAYQKTFPYEDDWLSDKARVSAGFEVPSMVNGGDRLEVRITVIGGTYCNSNMIIYIDEVMLEEGIGVSSYSLVNAGKFEIPNTNFTAEDTGTLTSFWTSYGQSYQYVTTNSLFGTSLKISGDISKEKYVKQRIYTASEEQLSNFDALLAEESLAGQGPRTEAENLTYQISGFARSFAAVSKFETTSWLAQSPNFRLKVKIGYYQGTNNSSREVGYYYDFLPGCTDWQFLSGTFNTGADDKEEGYDYRCVEYIDIYCEYSYQPGSYAAFDNISVICCTDESIAKCTYYEDGMIKSARYDYYEEEYQ